MKLFYYPPATATVPHLQGASPVPQPSPGQHMNSSGQTRSGQGPIKVVLRL